MSDRSRAAPGGEGASEGRIDQEYYDASGYFDDGASAHLLDHDSPFQRYRIRKVLAIHPLLPTDRVVDLGCGWGTFGFALAPKVREIVGVDFSRRSVEICREQKRRRGIENVRFVQADAGDTGLPGGDFDVVLAADLFEHLYPDDSERVAREAYRLLRPGGRFVTWTPHRGHVLEALKNRDIVLQRDPTHVDYKSMKEMKRLLSDAGFGIERAYYAESHVPVLRALERAFQGIVPFLRRRIAVLGRKPDDKEAGPDDAPPAAKEDVD